MAARRIGRDESRGAEQAGTEGNNIQQIGRGEEQAASGEGGSAIKDCAGAGDRSAAPAGVAPGPAGAKPKRPAAKRAPGPARKTDAKAAAKRSAKPVTRKKVTKPVAAMRGATLGIDAGRKPQVRRQTRAGWTRRKELIFLETLAETCNVLMAAEAADVWPQSAYQRRKLNAAFRNGWAEALRIGYARLELVLLERALQGSEKIVRHKDGSEERMREYSNQVALTLLKLHRDAGGGGGEGEASSSAEEARDAKTRIARKLSKLKERFDGTDVLAIAYGGAAGVVGAGASSKIGGTSKAGGSGEGGGSGKVE